MLFGASVANFELMMILCEVWSFCFGGYFKLFGSYHGNLLVLKRTGLFDPENTGLDIRMSLLGVSLT